MPNVPQMMVTQPPMQMTYATSPAPSVQTVQINMQTINTSMQPPIVQTINTSMQPSSMETINTSMQPPNTQTINASMQAMQPGTQVPPQVLQAMAAAQNSRSTHPRMQVMPM